MNKINHTLFAALTLACASAFAAAPDLKTTESVTINAPVDKVWAMVKDFNGLNNWHPAVAKDEIVSGTNNKPGAVRVLTLKDGGTIKEELLEMKDGDHQFKYKILEGVLPVSNYTSMLHVKAEGKDKSKVVWAGHFKRKNTGDNPGEKENDKAATDTMSAVYKGGLENLKKNLEAAK